MLQHDPESSQNGPDAAHTRVKVDVLARAIAAIEERRQEQARQMEGTALIGDVVRDLQIDATPEELLAEVEAQQKATLVSKNASPQERTAEHPQQYAESDSRAYWSVLKAVGGVVAAIMIVFWMIDAQPPPSSRSYAPGVGQATQTYTPQNSPTTPPHPFFSTSQPLGMLSAEDEFQRGGPAHALADIADGHPFGCSTYTLESLLRHEPMSDIYLYDAERDMTYDLRKPGSALNHFPPNEIMIGWLAKSAWTLIKHNGQVYLRGWVGQDTAQQLASQKVVSIFNLQSPTEKAKHLVPITLPLATVNSEGLYQQMMDMPFGNPYSRAYNPRQPGWPTQELLVQGLPPDSHTWEKWHD